ncbi:MAG: Wzz/FepE/Etk N-terminal domain-containing protein [Patescibacteria group bacterium]
MEITEFFAIVKRRLLLIILIVVVITGAASYYSLNQKESFQTSAIITVQAKRENSTQYQYSSFYAIQASELFINTIIGWIRSTSFVSDVYAKSGISVESGKLNALSKSIYTQKIPPQNISLIVSNSNKKQAEEVASNIIKTVEERIAQLGKLDQASTDFEIVSSQLITTPVQQNTLLTIFVAFIISLILALIATFIRESFSPTINTTFAVLSIFNTLPLSLRKIKLQGLFHPETRVAEKFRYIRSNLNLFKGNNGNFSIVVSDAGKRPIVSSTIAANLALSYARSGKKTLVVDAYFDQPQIHDFWHVKNDTGFAETLTQENNFTQHIKKTDEQNLWLLSTGNKLTYAADTIERAKLKELMTEFGEKFECIIFHVPSLAISSECLPLLLLTKNTLISISLGNTPVNNLKYIASLLSRHETTTNLIVS